MREAWKTRIWVVDGHNMIFAIPSLGDLQHQGAGQEARRGLEELLQPFASQLTERLTIVYDGNRLLPNPDATTTPFLRTLYSRPPEEADDRIVFLASEGIRRGKGVAVISNDRRSLAPRLPQGTVLMGVEEFRIRCIQSSRTVPDPDEPRVEDRDVAQQFLERGEEIERSARRGAARLERQARRKWLARPGVQSGPPKARSGVPSGSRPLSGEYEGEGQHRWHGERRASEFATAKAEGCENAAPTVQDEERRRSAAAADRARQAKKKRGLRKQKRRLARLQRSRPSSAGSGKGRRSRT